MSEQHQELVPALAGRIALASDRATSERAVAEKSGNELPRTSGDGDALRKLAERMAPRVRQVARALMGRSLDADDAALHALVELLRAYSQRRGEEEEEALDRWVDRVAALSVLRFARAVRKRTPAGRLQAKAWGDGSDERNARTFEQYLRVLSETSREVLLLRHALGFRVVDLPDALRCSTRSAKERLLAARRELRRLVRPRANQDVGAGAQRWCALRDLEAVDEQLSDAEQQEVAELEASEPEIWAYVAQVRALELYFAAHGEPPRDEDRALIEAALSSVQITARQVLGRALDGDAEFDRSIEAEGDGWAQLVAIGGSVALALGCVVALLMREPGHSRAAAPEPHAEAAPGQREQMAPAFHPTVESLASARTAQRGGRLRRTGRQLSAGALLGQGDVVESAERAGCLELGDHDALCLGSGSALRIVSLLRRQPSVELLRGRLVVNGDERASSARVEVRAAAWLVSNPSGGVVAVERAADLASVRVRALRGSSRLTFAEQVHVLAPAYAALLQEGQSAPVVVALPQLIAQRDWELLATLGKPSLLPAPAGPVARANGAGPLDEGQPAPSSERPASTTATVQASAPIGQAESSSTSGSPTATASGTTARATSTEAARSSEAAARESPKPMPAAAAALAELAAPASDAPVSERAKRAAAAVDDILLERPSAGEVVAPAP